jgi:hypothetical protein
VFNGANSNPVVLWDTLPDVGQIPASVMNIQNGAATLIGVESSKPLKCFVCLKYF